MKAVVFGGTGAVGKEVVRQLLGREQWSKVVTIGRSKGLIEAPQGCEGKFEQVVIDMDNLQKESEAYLQGVDAVFCALGTTRSVAGSAEAFRKVDLDYVEAAARGAAAGGVKLFSLVSSAGANAKVWASDVKLCHPLLYVQTKGKAEEAVKQSGVPLVSIFRPGMLDRKDPGRALESFATKLLPKIDVADVAKAMILDAERRLSGVGEGAMTFEMKDIKELAKEAKAAEAGTVA